MKRKTFVRLSSFLGSYLILTLLLVGAFLVISVNAHSTTERKSAPTTLTKAEALGAVPVAQPTPKNGTADFVPFLHIEPEANGQALAISLNREGSLPDVLYANLVGPTGHKDSWTLPYSTTVQSYARVIPFASSNTVGSVNITTTQGLNSAAVRFRRAFVQTMPGAVVTSVDNSFNLELRNAGTLATPAYMVVTTNVGQPGSLKPSDLTLLGPSYSIRRDSHIETTARAMALNLSYATVDLRGADWRTLDIYRWDGVANRWLPLGAEHSATNQAFSARTSLFGTYVLASRPRWVAGFADPRLSVLDGDKSQVKRAGVPDHFVLTLNTNRTTGSALSIPITPRFGLESWGTVVFTATTTQTATLTVDVLDSNQQLVLANVANGQSLANLDPQLYPALRLRVNMTATAPGGALPTLAGWQVSWQPPRPASFEVGSGTLALGELVTVPVALTEAPSAGLSGVSLAVTYDPALLEPTACSPKSLTGAAASCNPATSSTPGEVRLSLLVSPALTSAVELADLTFRAIGWVAAGAPLSLTTPIAVNAEGKALAVITQNGQVTFSNQPTGDVNCDGQTNHQDAQLILEYSVTIRQGVTTCPPPAGAIFTPQCDVTGDTVCDLRDAQRLWQPAP